MLMNIIRIFWVFIGGSLGFLYYPFLLHQLTGEQGLVWWNSPYLGMCLGAIISFLLTFRLSRSMAAGIKALEEKVVGAPVVDVLFGSLGLMVGLFVSFMIALPLHDLGSQLGTTLLFSLGVLWLTFLLGYLGFRVGYKKRDELYMLFTSAKSANPKKKVAVEESSADVHKTDLKILDTSVIIDGRIADICKTGFLEGTLVIPQFVLEELQHIADSSDVLKRNRGRRGLDILNKIQKELQIKVEIYEGDFEEIQEVDSKLIKLAKLVSGVVVTNDFNLNKVCELQNVAVLNINDLANAVKPVVLPGEEMTVQVIKDGKEHNQGVAYLDDGTMIVVEDGSHYIGKRIEVLVTSVLQTSAGRMIFAKPKLLEKAL
ncbi:PIN/TRAM domain-containing protein [Bacillaceae bacterium SIJ1]|uniref:PIN/TRAM domain-containing protein n=1 Tax=Litoribacterium kuwaitense TaxID=1398745 RepID=UPI0013ECA8BE|nr:PIN/TRAM domain-containing protein [Litoribacterium kuwaitense]NGP46719.1 PIN/TRAM domain-containing protein [Litoribacterium kuwaitense]